MSLLIQDFNNRGNYARYAVGEDGRIQIMELMGYVDPWGRFRIAYEREAL